MKAELKNRIIYTVSILAFLFLWEVTARIINAPLVFPTLLQVAECFCKNVLTKHFWLSVLGSFCRVMTAFCVSFILGTVLGFASGLNKSFRIFMSFPLTFIKATPVVAFIMMVLFWFPSQALPSICAVLMTLPVMTDGVSGAVRNTEKNLLDLAKVFNFSFSVKLRKIYFSGVRPYLFTTARTVFAQIWKVVAAGEILSLPGNALGTMIQDNRMLLEPDKVFALVLALVFLCVISEKILFKFFKIMGITRERLWRSRVGSFAAPASASEPAVFVKPQALQTAQAPDAEMKIERLSFSYKTEKGDKEIFNDFSCSFKSYSRTALTGPSGKGKSTLLKILSGIIPEKQLQGRVECGKVSFVFQENVLISELTVIENIALPLFSVMKKKDAYRKAFESAAFCGLKDKVFQKTGTLSGGEKQRVQIARAFAYPSEVLLMDEGTSSLDEKSREEIWQTINILLNKKPRTFLFVTHDMEEAEKYADNIVSV